MDEIIIDVRGLPPNQSYSVYAIGQENEVAILTAVSNEIGAISEVLAFVHFFQNHFNGIILRKSGR